MLYFLFAFLLVLADQALKFWVLEHIPLHTSIEFIPHLCNLTYIQNTGAAFSSLSGHTQFLALVSLVVSVFLAYLLAKPVFSRPLGKLSLAMVLGGGVGNMIDRAFRGFVVDMFDLQFIRFAIFNVADICVVIGGIGLAYYYIFCYEKYDAPPEEKEKNTENVENSDSPEEQV